MPCAVSQPVQQIPHTVEHGFEPTGGIDAVFRSQQIQEPLLIHPCVSGVQQISQQEPDLPHAAGAVIHTIFAHPDR